MEYSTENMYLAKMGTLSYDDCEDEFSINSDINDIGNGYTIVYYKGGEFAKDVFSYTNYLKYSYADEIDDINEYNEQEVIIHMSPIVEYMKDPSTVISARELVKILNNVDPNRCVNVNDIVLLLVRDLHYKASNILKRDDLETFNIKLLDLSNRYLLDLAISKNDNSSNNKVDIKEKYLRELFELDKKLNVGKDDLPDYYCAYQNIKLLLQL